MNAFFRIILAYFILFLAGCFPSTTTPELPATPAVVSITAPDVSSTISRTEPFPEPIAYPGPSAPIPSTYPYPAVKTVMPAFTHTPNLTQTPTETLIPCPPFNFEPSLPNPETPEAYIGRHYDTRSTPGLKMNYGAAIGNQTDRGEYNLEEIETTRYKMFWFEKLVCRNQQGHAFFEISDVIVLPPIKPNEIVVMLGCKQGGKYDEAIVAVGDFKEREVLLSNLSHVWRANRSTGKLEVISPEGITCERMIGGD